MIEPLDNGFEPPLLRLVEECVTRATRSLDVLCDTRMATGPSVADLARLRTAADRRGVRLRVYARHGAADEPAGEVYQALESLEHAGWEVKSGTAATHEDACVLMDTTAALLWPVEAAARMTVKAADVNALAAHFDTVWQASAQILYEDFVQPSHPNFFVPFQTAAEHWDRIIRELSQRPTDLPSMDPLEFERLVEELLRRDGFSNVQLTSRSHDGGRDLLVATDTVLGQHLYLVECKRYRPDRPVNVGLVRSLYGVAEAEGATAALLVTTSYFTNQAVAFRERVPHRLGFTDYERLVEWLQRLSR